MTQNYFLYLNLLSFIFYYYFSLQRDICVLYTKANYGRLDHHWGWIADQKKKLSSSHSLFPNRSPLSLSPQFFRDFINGVFRPWACHTSPPGRPPPRTWNSTSTTSTATCEGQDLILDSKVAEPSPQLRANLSRGSRVSLWFRVCNPCSRFFFYILFLFKGLRGSLGDLFVLLLISCWGLYNF